ncbi:uncharacterized protein Triagg1_10816 [Trichoderma aggressivum f. europaeum]|uniref:Ankyrin repeat protein n=1 Tax=Trichoderma aggressivum f. europaeum TaxID=173218 RepID=A0AAE1IZJ7_9HYPO|nr:hypothetical protein Triagg1_10816 [Trichoderma aggressivum f. europaeum]
MLMPMFEAWVVCRLQQLFALSVNVLEHLIYTLKCLTAVEDFIALDLLSVRDKAGRTALHIAASSGDSTMTSKIVDVLKKESRFEEAVNYRDITNKTPLQYAAKQRHTAIVEEFLIHQDCVETENYNSAAEFAAASGHLSTVRLFMFGSKESFGIQMLLAVSEAGNLEVVQYLLMEKHVSPSTRKGRINVINLLLKFKPNIHSRSKKEETPLRIAVAHPEAVEALLKADADPNSVDKERQTPLHCAVREKRSPLYYAIANNHLSTVEKFLQDGVALVNLSTVMSRAIESAAYTIFKYFMPLAQKKDFHLFKASLLHEAAVGGSMEILDVLLHSGVDANLRRNGYSALHLAAQYGCEDHVQKLIDFTAIVDARDDENRTPLHLAAQNNEKETVKILLRAGSEISAYDNDSVTPIYLASEFRAHRVLKTLLECNANMNIATLSQGWTPLPASIDRGRW